MAPSFLAAGLLHNLYRLYYSWLDGTEKKFFLQGVFWGGLAGVICAVPMVLAAIHRNQRQKQIERVFWVVVGAGALGGFILAVPCGIGAFLYALSMEKK
jgi:hypothetical protein